MTLTTEVFRAPCPEPGCDDGTGQVFNAKQNYATREDAAASLREHWGTMHAIAHVVESPIPAEFH